MGAEVLVVDAGTHTEAHIKVRMLTQVAMSDGCVDVQVAC